MPKRPDSYDKKTKHIDIKVSPKEYGQIAKQFKASRFPTVSSYVRSRLLRTRQPVKYWGPEDQRLVLTEMRRVGNLIMTSFAESEERTATLVEVREAFARIAKARDRKHHSGQQPQPHSELH